MCGRPRGAAVGLGEHIVKADGQSHGVECFDDRDPPLVAGLKRLGEGCAELVVSVVDAVGENVYFAIPDVGAQLGAGHYFHMHPLAGRSGLGDAHDRVVISQTHRLQARFAGLFDCLSRRPQPVRTQGMRVEIS